jgi:hypothetical protein
MPACPSPRVPRAPPSDPTSGTIPVALVTPAGAVGWLWPWPSPGVVAQRRDHELGRERLAGRPRRADLLAAAALGAGRHVEEVLPREVLDAARAEDQVLRQVLELGEVERQPGRVAQRRSGPERRAAVHLAPRPDVDHREEAVPGDTHPGSAPDDDHPGHRHDDLHRREDHDRGLERGDGQVGERRAQPGREREVEVERAAGLEVQRGVRLGELRQREPRAVDRRGAAGRRELREGGGDRRLVDVQRVLERAQPEHRERHRDDDALDHVRLRGVRAEEPRPPVPGAARLAPLPDRDQREHPQQPGPREDLDHPLVGVPVPDPREHEPRLDDLPVARHQREHQRRERQHDHPVRGPDRRAVRESPVPQDLGEHEPRAPSRFGGALGRRPSAAERGDDRGRAAREPRDAHHGDQHGDRERDDLIPQHAHTVTGAPVRTGRPRGSAPRWPTGGPRGSAPRRGPTSSPRGSAPRRGPTSSPRGSRDAWGW